MQLSKKQWLDETLKFKSSMDFSNKFVSKRMHHIFFNRSNVVVRKTSKGIALKQHPSVEWVINTENGMER